MACMHGKPDVPGCAACDRFAELERENKLQWENVQQLLAENLRLQKAVEFAEYMAKSAEHYMEATNKVLFAYHEDEEPDIWMRDNQGESFKSLRNDIYEFRKRKP